MPGADCVFELMLSSYSIILWGGCEAWIVFSARTVRAGEEEKAALDVFVSNQTETIFVEYSFFFLV